MPRFITIDKTVVDQINAGNVALANFLRARTANLFQKTRATSDNNNLLTGQGIGMMRWIRPELIRVLKDPV